MIAEKTPYAAATEYQRRIQRLLSCISRSVVKVAGGHNYSAPRSSHHLELPDGQPVALAGAHKLMFNMEPHFRVRRTESQAGLHYVEIVGYRYIVYDSGQREVLAYHWHPGPREFVQTPHFHLGSGARVGFDPLVSKTHLPTGYVTFGEIIRVLIRDLSVQPSRSDWEDVLRRNVEPVPAQ
ncbi:MAG: hypothetical protein F4Y49_04565 [Dehalococcoidia bacterium]|nr:hypothetical protein [Dehalococcoidia bacterium]